MENQVFFSPNTTVARRLEVCTRLNIMTEALTSKYLGVPLLVGAERSDLFQYLIDKICERLQESKEKLLSMGGKEVLVKAVAQPLSVFEMSVFNIAK
jgi:hypothetical protein